MHVELISPYSKSIRQQHPGGDIIMNNISLTCTTMIYPVTEWFEIFEISKFDLDEVTGYKNEYIDKASARVSHFLATHGLEDTRVHTKSCLTTGMSLN